MDTRYQQDERFTYQTIATTIQTTIDSVFAYLATDQINRWFKELSYDNEQKPEKLLFKLQNGEVKELPIIDYKKPNLLSFAWDVGQVTFELTDKGNSTLLTFKERLPLSFHNISQDFAGWYFQIDHLKQLAETAKMKPTDMKKFKAIQQEIIDTLNLAQ